MTAANDDLNWTGPDDLARAMAEEASTGLLPFLSACLDDEESRARAATPGPWHPKSRDDLSMGDFGWSFGAVTHTPDGFGGETTDSEQGKADSLFVGAFDPDYVIAQVNLKRGILSWHGRDVSICATCRDEEGNPVLWPCESVRIVAMSYSGRRGYDPGWGVQAEPDDL